MILSLDIKNIALIKNTTIKLSDGLNILTGETGAGKSIIIDSLKFVLGDRADRGLIRHNEEQAKVTICFSNDNLAAVNEIFDEFGIEIEENIIISRQMNVNGKSEVRINGNIVNLSVVKRIVNILIDVHAQHENTSLLNSTTHITILDNFSKEIVLNLSAYKNLYIEYNHIVSKLDNYNTEADRERRIELLIYQIDEIKNAKIEDGEEEILMQKRHKLLNIQKYLENLNNICGYFEGKNNLGITTLLYYVQKELQFATKFDETLSELNDRIDSVKIEINDIKNEISSKLEEENSDDNLETIENRINVIRTIKIKYGKTLEEIKIFLEKAEIELFNLQNSEEEIEKLNKKLVMSKDKIKNQAIQLHTLRQKNALELSKLIEQNLKDLGIGNAKFEIELVFNEENLFEHLTQNGGDSVQFLISPNLGEPLKPLSKIASGGEMSRFMLALKNIIAKQNDTQTLVFDEIDTGISGNIAKVVACKLYDIAKFRQVIIITHLPQICAMADTHFLIVKGTQDNSTITTVAELDENAMLGEIMRLAGSTDNTDLGLSHAKELKNWANKYKAK